MIGETNERLKPYQTDNLILLVGTNPLPNYVAARLLRKPPGKIHLVYTSSTASIAERLGQKLAQSKLETERRFVRESQPREIFSCVSEITATMQGSVGLHYTGGTKAMAVHAYRAVKAARSDAVCSYLDAHKLKMVIDGRTSDEADIEIEVGKAVTLGVHEIAALHNIEFSHSESSPFLLEVAKTLQKNFETSGAWLAWARANWAKEEDKEKLKSAADLKAIHLPHADFPEISRAFQNLGAPADATLEDWINATKHFQTNSDGTKKFVKWLSGGYWLESIVLDALWQIKQACAIDDCGMGYETSQSKFEFDVAATRGYQLFAISCTTESKAGLCKQKLFEGFERAKQIGGDEARTALVCYNQDAANLLDKFKRENFFAEGTVTVFGAKHLQELPRYLADWIKHNSHGGEK